MMTLDRALRLARKWASGGVCTLREGEAQEYHQLCAEALERSRWIPVTERLPKPNLKVLILCKNDAMFVGIRTQRYSYGEELRWGVYSALGSLKVLTKGRVTHWMPLPNKPKEE